MAIHKQECLSNEWLHATLNIIEEESVSDDICNTQYSIEHTPVGPGVCNTLGLLGVQEGIVLGTNYPQAAIKHEIYKKNPSDV